MLLLTIIITCNNKFTCEGNNNWSILVLNILMIIDDIDNKIPVFEYKAEN